MAIKSNNLIKVDKRIESHIQWWSNVWRTNEFRSWDDADDWLIYNFLAEAIKTINGFDLKFNSKEDMVRFKLIWVL